MKLPQIPTKEPIRGLLSVPWLLFFTNLLEFLKEVPTQENLDTVSHVAKQNNDALSSRLDGITAGDISPYVKWIEQDTVNQPITSVTDSLISTETINTITEKGDLQIDSYLYIDEVATNANPNLIQLYVTAYKNDTFAGYSTDAAVFVPSYSSARSTFLAVMHTTLFISGVAPEDVIKLEITGHCDHDNKVDVGMMHNYCTLYKQQAITVTL